MTSYYIIKPNNQNIAQIISITNDSFLILIIKGH